MAELAWSRDGATWPHHGASRFVTAAGIRWHVQEMGQGPVVLLVHGTGAATHSWRGLMPLLAQTHRVIAIDLPGHGFTQTPAPQRLTLPGMAADIAVYSRDLLTATPEQVRDETHCDLTLLAGKPVHDRLGQWRQ